MKKNIILVAVLSLVLLISAYGQPRLGTLVKKAKKSGIYREDMLIKMRIMDENGNPLPGVKLEIKSEIDPRELIAGENGYITINTNSITNEVIEENPVIEVTKAGYEGEISGKVSFTASGKSSEKTKKNKSLDFSEINVIDVNPDNLENLSTEAVAVYYPENYENMAKEIFGLLKKERRFLMSTLGCEPLRLGTSSIRSGRYARIDPAIKSL